MWKWVERFTSISHDGPQLEAANERLRQLNQSADRVVPEIQARRARNHWDEVFAQLTHKSP